MTSRISLGLLVDQAFYGSPYQGKDAWRAAAELGAEWICIVEEAMEIAPERLLQFRDDADAVGLPISLTACHAFGLSDFRDVVREFHLKRAEAHVDLTRELGGEVMKLLLGDWFWRAMWPEEAQWQLLAASVRRLADYAEARGIALSVKPEPMETSLVTDVDDLVRLLDDVASPALQANVDVSHLVVAGVAASEVGRLPGRVNSVDYSDSNGTYHEHLVPGEGVADMAAFTDQLLAVDAAWIGVEVGPFADPENAYDKVGRAMARSREFFDTAAARRV
ncbi:sugar phosphate isomerase/epimerase family protein [Streptomyces chrestomyceticus]|uniref:sugar phosphate isomerase/epimerase family protein n=1 Tax=Streptomyces chrestomyceticus TaxID=68185 RepID=UPI0019D22F51|nr:sugar phosphate isomerase/epimerase family protein [Streptomyces chrestomyceticus]